MKKKRDIEGYIRKVEGRYQVKIVEYPHGDSPYYRERILTSDGIHGYETETEAVDVIKSEIKRFEYKAKLTNIAWTKVEV